MNKLIGALAAVTMWAGISTAAEAATAQVVNGAVRMRVGPSVHDRIMFMVPSGELIDVSGCLTSQRWCRATYGGVSGWVSRRHLAFLSVGRPSDITGSDDSRGGGGSEGYVRILGQVVDRPGYCYALSESGNSIIVRCPSTGRPTGTSSDDGEPAGGQVGAGGSDTYVKILGQVVDRPGYCYALSESGDSIVVKCP